MKKNTKNVSTISLTVCAAAMLSVACSKKSKKEDEDTSNVKYSGKTAAGLRLTLQESAELETLLHGLKLQSAITADTIQPFFIKNLEPHYPYATYKASTIQSDGSFQFDVRKSDAEGLLLVLVNSKATKPIDRVVGYVGFSDPALETALIKMPVPQDKQNVDVGTQSENNGQVESDKKLTDMPDTFSTKLVVLREISKSNDTLKSIKNLYANTNTTDGVYYKMDTSHYFNLDVSAAQMGDWIAPSKLEYTGLNFNVRTTNPAITFEKLCTLKTDANHKTYALIPPSAVTTETRGSSTRTQTTVSSFDNDSFVASDISSSSCGNASFYTSQSTGGVNVTFASGQIRAASLPEGNWTLKYDGNQVAEFDVNTTKPLNKDKKIVGYVPSFKVTLDSDNFVTKVQVKLYTWNGGTDAYEEVTDLTTFATQAFYPSLAIFDFSDKASSQRVTDSIVSATNNDSAAWKKAIVGNEIVLTPSYRFKFAAWDTTADYTADSINFQYTINGVQMFYTLQPTL